MVLNHFYLRIRKRLKLNNMGLKGFNIENVFLLRLKMTYCFCKIKVLIDYNNQIWRTTCKYMKER